MVQVRPKKYRLDLKFESRRKLIASEKCETDQIRPDKLNTDEK